MSQIGLWQDSKSVFTFLAQGFKVPVVVRKVDSGMPPLFKVELRAVQGGVIWMKIDGAGWVFDFRCFRPFALDKKLPDGCTAIVALVSIVWREERWRAELLGERVFRDDEPVLLGRPVLLGDVIGQPNVW